MSDTTDIINIEVIAMVQTIIQFAITCIIGWVVVERVICYFREVKTAHQWRKYYNDKFNGRQ